MDIIYPDGEYATNLIITNVKTLSHNDSSSHSFSSDGHEIGGGGAHAPLAFSGSATVPYSVQPDPVPSCLMCRNVLTYDIDSGDLVCNIRRATTRPQSHVTPPRWLQKQAQTTNADSDRDRICSILRK